jgi:hypothetical protein
LSFYTAVNCMDGRVQLPVIEYLMKQHGVQHVDMITEPGPVRALAGRDEEVAGSIERRVGISLRVHSSCGVVVVAHADCAGNPVGHAAQLDQLRLSVERLSARFPGVSVRGLWVGEDWRVEETAAGAEPGDR